MLICTCPIDEDCPAWGQGLRRFPWCDYLKDDGTDDDDDFCSYGERREGE